MHSQIEKDEAYRVIDQSLKNCISIRSKLKERSSQFSLNTNRIKALELAKDLIENGNTNLEDIDLVRKQLESIKNKSLSGLKNARVNTSTSTRFKKLIQTMDFVLSKLDLLENKEE